MKCECKKLYCECLTGRSYPKLSPLYVCRGPRMVEWAPVGPLYYCPPPPSINAPLSWHSPGGGRPLSWAVAAGDHGDRLSYPVKCGEDPLIMVLAAGNRGGGGGGLWTEGNWIPLTIATMITSQLHLITDKIVPIWSPGVRRWRRGPFTSCQMWWIIYYWNISNNFP